ncbi:MAG: prephenate dehydrogenase [Fimbriimonadales bacterium]
MRRRSFGRVGIVGLGLVGSSLGLALRKHGVCKEVFGFDTDPEARDTALQVGAVEQTYETLNHLAAADILVLAVPPPAVVPCLVEADVFARDGCIVTDTVSVKAGIVSWTKTYPLRFRPRFVGGHPMAGRANSGPAHATADLFEGATWVLTPTADTDKAALRTIQGLVESIGSKPLLLSPEEHDRHAAVLSHLPHVLAATLMRMSAMLTHPQMAGPSWADLTRVAASSPELWQSIIANNRDEVVSALHDLEYHLKEMRDFIQAHDDQKVLELLSEAKRLKDETNR